MTKLVKIQEWFGALISQPLTSTFSKEEVGKYITPSKALEPHQRLKLYHQQYWWRLLSCLQENFPALTLLYGYERFNDEIGIPYLSENPPTHWALCRLGQSLPGWFKEKDLERDLATIEAATQASFWSKEQEPCDLNLEKKVFLQPHIHLFELGGDLFTFRDELLKEHSVTEVRQGKCFFVLYRNPKNQVKWKEISIGEHRLLTLLKKGTSIQEALDQIELEGGEPFREAEELLPLWFREWTYLKWFWEE